MRWAASASGWVPPNEWFWDFVWKMSPGEDGKHIWELWELKRGPNDSSKWSCSNSNIVLGFCQNLSDTERCYGVQLHLNISEKLRQPSWTIVKHFDSIYSIKHFLHNTTTPDIICDDFVGGKHTRTDHIHPILTLVKHAARIDISRRSMNSIATIRFP